MEIDDSAGFACRREEGEEASGELGLDRVGDEALKRLGVKFVAGDLALDGPEVAVDVEDSIAEELMEDVMKARTFDVIGEVGDEEVVDVEGVGSADAMGGVEEGVDLESEGRGSGKHVSNPVVEAVVVAEESDQVSDDRV